MAQLDAEKIKGVDEKFCESCGNIIKIKAELCPNCGVRQKTGINKAALLLLTFFLGGIGAHKFYIKKTGQGVAYLLFCWTGIPGLVALIEFFIYIFTDTETLKEKYPESSGGGLIIGLVVGGFVFVVMIGILAAIAIPNFVAYRTRAYDSMANADIKNAYTCAQAYFVDNPNATVSTNELSQVGYLPTEGVVLTIESGKWETLEMTSAHENGRKVFSINSEGVMSVGPAR
jgi:TM2 domain-containing membrane protein YozV/Tfp pilus assembly protein PilE